jgi:hypothetical protein
MVNHVVHVWRLGPSGEWLQRVASDVPQQCGIENVSKVPTKWPAECARELKMNSGKNL